MKDLEQFLISTKFLNDFTKLINDRLDRYNSKKHKAKRRKLRESLNNGEKVLVLAERIKKKSAPGKFYK